MERNKQKPHHLAGPHSAETQEFLDDVVPVEHTTTKTAQEKCPKCPRLVTSVYQSGNKKFYNHGEGGSMTWKDGQTFDLKFADYCTVEIEMEPKGKASAGGQVMALSLYKGSIGMHVGYSELGFSNNLKGRNFAYSVWGGKPYLHIDMSGNLHVKNKAANSYTDALEFVEHHAQLEHLEIGAESVVREFARLAQADPTEWILELDFAEKGNFLYAVAAMTIDSMARFDVRFKGTRSASAAG
jgi:hypothetical protein